MRIAICILCLASLVSFATAQDLDVAMTGVSAPQQQPDTQEPSAYDILVARVLRAEARYMSHRAPEAEWIQYRYVARLAPGANEFVGWFMTDRQAFDLREQLSPAEMAAFQSVMRESQGRVVAAGLN